ncbi:MAG: hypothetical protein FJ090_03855 [Deltaproteobacteria bacterium]|nr:hypothetical protein [Deltaproteobacteria bacterium]
MLLVLFGCPSSDTPAPPDSDLAALEARINELQEQLDQATAANEEALAALQAQLDDGGTTVDTYTDEDAIAAVQNSDPWNQPDQANLQYLWSSTDYGYQWLENSRWTMDNRSNPAGEAPRHELVQMFHETTACTESSTFADCNSTAALKFYVNGPSTEDNDWSVAGYEKQAVKHHNTHASGIYLVSFGQGSTVTDYASALIPPSGIHLEPWGAHQAIRVDGSQNSGDNVRIDTTPGSTGIAVYQSESAASTCSVVRTDCETSYPLYLRGGTLHLEDLSVERSADDGRGAGPENVYTESVGIEHFYSWHTDEVTGLPVHCTWNTRLTDDSFVRVQAYTTSDQLLVAHSYAVVDVWGPGNAPPSCTGTQLIKTDAAGVYGYGYAASTMANGGFSVAILGPDSMPLYPGDWGEADRPSFLYEVIEPL